MIAVLLAMRAGNPALATRLVAEDSVVEWLQILLTAAAAVLAALQDGARPSASDC